MYDTLVAVRRVESVELYENDAHSSTKVIIDVLNPNELLKEVGLRMEKFIATMPARTSHMPRNS